MAKCAKCSNVIGQPVFTRFHSAGGTYMLFSCPSCQTVISVAPDADTLVDEIRRELQRR